MSTERVYYEANVTAEVKTKRTTTFLLGVDETSHFISVLPKKVENVAAAHELLKPEEFQGKKMPKGTKRQGEFFLVPVSDEEVNKFMTENKLQVRQGVPLEKHSNHKATYAIPASIKKGYARYDKARAYGNVVYAKGSVYDNRGYRHAPVELGDTWHKVVRNNEKQIKLEPSQRRTVRYD
jgi:hypothetical protein